MLSVAMKDKAPYREVLTHGFTVDGNEYFLTYGDVQVIKIVLQRKYKSDLIQMLAFYI